MVESIVENAHLTDFQNKQCLWTIPLPHYYSLFFLLPIFVVYVLVVPQFCWRRLSFTPITRHLPTTCRSESAFCTLVPWLKKMMERMIWVNVNHESFDVEGKPLSLFLLTKIPMVLGLTMATPVLPPAPEQLITFFSLYRALNWFRMIEWKYEIIGLVHHCTWYYRSGRSLVPRSPITDKGAIVRNFTSCLCCLSCSSHNPDDFSISRAIAGPRLTVQLPSWGINRSLSTSVSSCPQPAPVQETRFRGPDPPGPPYIQQLARFFLSHVIAIPWLLYGSAIG